MKYIKTRANQNIENVASVQLMTPVRCQRFVSKCHEMCNLVETVSQHMPDRWRWRYWRRPRLYCQCTDVISVGSAQCDTIHHYKVGQCNDSATMEETSTQHQQRPMETIHHILITSIVFAILLISTLTQTVSGKEKETKGKKIFEVMMRITLSFCVKECFVQKKIFFFKRNVNRENRQQNCNICF